jgi:hypothetical protein
MNEKVNAADALALTAAARQRMADRAKTPWWYPPVYGIGCGGMIASLALPISWIWAGVIVCSAIISCSYVAWMNMSGLSVSGYRPGRTRRITALLVVGFLAFAAAALVLRYRAGLVWAPVVCGLVFAPIAALASAAWDRAWRTDILSGA